MIQIRLPSICRHVVAKGILEGVLYGTPGFGPRSNHLDEGLQECLWHGEDVFSCPEGVYHGFEPDVLVVADREDYFCLGVGGDEFLREGDWGEVCDGLLMALDHVIYSRRL